MKLWKGRFQKEADPKTNDFNSSIPARWLSIRTRRIFTPL